MPHPDVTPDPRDAAPDPSRAPVGLLCLDGDGYVTAVNTTVQAWSLRTADDPHGSSPVGHRIGELFTVGGRIYWDTHVAPALVLAGRVDAIALDLRTTHGPLPVLMTATTDPAGGTDVAMLEVCERAQFQQELVRARATAERWADRLRWVQDATAALSRAVGVAQVRDALVAEVARHPAVAHATLTRARPELGPAHAAHRAPDGRLVATVVGTAGSHGDLVVTLHERAGDTPVDLDALDTIAQQGAVALDRAHLHEHSASVAHELQHAMLTDDLPRHRGLHVRAHYRPAVRGLEVGGDWYDAFWLDPTHLALVVGDVVGHGLPAATAMGQLRTATRALAAPGRTPAHVVELVDRFVTDRHVGFGSTLVYGELDLTTSRFTYATAGHLPPLHVDARGACTYLWQGRATPLGVRDAAPRPGGEITLAAGDTVLLYTDGVVERRDRSLPDGLGELALAAAARLTSGEPVAALVEDGAEGRDDACVLSVTWDAGAR
ncbi:PP2C family protein-serine/threonine phosphatase [Isoptericola jiangsuensis]|uniref:PP2C family protein-serine/threonine phosphatase n=1 Tax=Isoptericola jiangsuensis TaxID=548579 RepID=UPI003AAC393E